jgi:hypothetical protein
VSCIHSYLALQSEFACHEDIDKVQVVEVHVALSFIYCTTRIQQKNAYAYNTLSFFVCILIVYIYTQVAYLLYSGDEGGNLTVTDLKPLLLALPVYYNDSALRLLQSAIVVANPRRVEQRDAVAAVAYSRSSSSSSSRYSNSSYTSSSCSETEGLIEGLPVLTSLYAWRAHTDSVMTVTLVQHPPALATSGLDR